MKRLLHLLLLFTLSIPVAVSSQTISLELNPDLKNQMNLTELSSGTYEITTQGGDPWVITRPISAYDPSEVYVISFDYIAAEGLDNFQIFYGRPISPSTRRIDFGSLAPSTEFTTFKAFMKYEVTNWDTFYDSLRLDLGRSAGQTITITNLVIRSAEVGEIVPVSLNPEQRNQMAITEDPAETFSINTLGNDPYVYTDPIPVYDPEQNVVLSFQYTSSTGIDFFDLFYGFPPSPDRRIQLGPIPASNTPKTYTIILPVAASAWDQYYDQLRFDFGRSPGQNITVSNLVLREPTNAEKPALKVEEQFAIELDVIRTSPFLSATELADGSYQLATEANDPWILSKPVEVRYDIEETYILTFEYKAETAYNELQVFFAPPLTGQQSFTADVLPAAADWTTVTINPKLLVDNFQNKNWNQFRFDFGRNENEEKSIFIRNITLRKPTVQELFEEQNSDKFISRALDATFQAYLDTTFENVVTDVVVTQDQVIVSGTAAGTSQLFLAEATADLYGFDAKGLTTFTPVELIDQKFKLEFPRFETAGDHYRDRLYSRWVLVDSDDASAANLASNLKWPTNISAGALNNLPEEKARSVKGLDGLTPATLPNFSDLTDLDITSMKINLLLNGVFSINPSELTHEFNGKVYNINANFVGNLDSRLKALSDADIKASVVLLIPLTITNPDLDRIFTHPDASLGNYSMANVATAEGVEYYAAMIDFLAKRYSRADKQFGRLDQWIIHNEVDAHTSWTHAGQKPVDLYTQIYDRSMRLVHYTIRKHNPTAKVFGSYTKHFNSKAVSDANFRSKDVLSTLVQLSQKEGDYEWGIGWHSYPTNLFNPLVWNDAPAQTQFNFDTPQITPRNLEMIDAYVRQKEVLYNGKKVRTILLSENGFSSNTDRNANANETTQAAALAYFWKKTNNRLPAIENIQLHRWVDNPNEAGLLFGLWTVQEGTIEGFDQKKEGWYVWEAAGTANEDAFFEPYKAIIGIDDWSEIYDTVVTETTPHTVTMNINGCSTSLDELLVTFNGEYKKPQEDGSLIFYNVASNVDQPYQILKGSVVLDEAVLQVSSDLDLVISLEAFARVSSRGIAPNQIEISWTSNLAETNGYQIEVKTGNSDFSILDQVGTDTTAYVHDGVQPGTRYTYRVAALLDDNQLSCYSEETEVVAPFIIVNYRDGDKEKTESNKIRPHLILQNELNEPVKMERLSVRYWFTAENATGMVFKAEQTGIFNNKEFFGNFTPLVETRDGADHYLELTFGPNASLPALGNSQELRMKIEKENPSPFDEYDDYSYADYSSFTQTDRITVYWDDELIWGVEPSPASQDSSDEDLQDIGQIAPNPAKAQTILYWGEPVEAFGSFFILDYQGNATEAQILLLGTQELQINLPVLQTGIYILKGSINGKSFSKRLMIN